MSETSHNDNQWVILPLNFGRSKALTLTGLAAGFLSSWFVAIFLRAGWLFLIAGKALSANLLSVLFSLFLPEFLALAIWLILRETRDHFQILEERYFLHDQAELDPLSQYYPPGTSYLRPQLVLNGAYFSGLLTSARLLFMPLVLTVLIFWALSPDDNERRYREFALTHSVMPEPAKSYFFPDAVGELLRGEKITPRGRCLAESIFLGQLLALAVFALGWYRRFAKRELNNGNTRVERGASPAPFPFGKTRDGGML